MAAPSSTCLGHSFAFLCLPFPSSLIKIHKFVIPRPLHGYAAAIQIPKPPKLEGEGGEGKIKKKLGSSRSIHHHGLRWRGGGWGRHCHPQAPGYCNVSALEGPAGILIFACFGPLFGEEHILWRGSCQLRSFSSQLLGAPQRRGPAPRPPASRSIVGCLPRLLSL